MALPADSLVPILFVLLGALTAFFSLVPCVGTVGAWIPVAIFLLAKGVYWRSALVLVWGARGVAGFEDSQPSRLAVSIFRTPTVVVSKT